MHRLSRERLAALFATVLGGGVGAACNHEGDAPPVTAREVPPFADAAVAPSPSASASTAPMADAATTTTESANDAGIAIAPAAVDASVATVALAGPQARDTPLPIAWLRATNVMPPTALPTPPPTPPPPPGAIGRNPQASCGMVSRPEPMVEIDVPLMPRDDLATADRARAERVVYLIRRGASGCLSGLPRLTADGMIVVLVRAHTSGHHAATAVEVSPSVPATARACIAKIVTSALGGDDEARSLSFNVTRRFLGP